MYRQPSLGLPFFQAVRGTLAPVSVRSPFRQIRGTIQQVQAKAPAPVRSGGRSFARFAPLFQARLAQRIPPQVVPYLKRGATYLGEDEAYYYVMEPAATDGLGGIFDKIGDVFKKIPKAFAPKNLYKTFIDTTLTVASGGLYLLAPKKLKGEIRKVANVAVPVIAGGVLAYTAGPAVMSMLMPKLKAAGSLISKGAGSVFGMFGGSKGGTPQDPGSAVIGQATGQGGNVYQEGGQIDPVAIGGAVIGLLQRLPQHKQAEVVERLTPEDIAYMERYNRVPPHLEQYFNQMGQGPVAPQGSYGAAELYPGAGSVAPVEAGMFGNMDPMTLGLLIGVPAIFFLFTQSSGKK